MNVMRARFGKQPFLVDCNGYQAFGKIEQVWNMEPLADKWKAFGFETHDVNLTSDPTALLRTLKSERSIPKKPRVILCRTKKGMGIPYLENDPTWHNKSRLTLQDVENLRKGLMG